MRYLLFYLFMMLTVLVACNQEQDGEPTMNNNEGPNSTSEQQKHEQPPEGSGGIVAGSLETTLQVNGKQATFRVKNQTEQVKELIFKDGKAFEYTIKDENGKVVFEKSLDKNSGVTLKQAEELVYEFEIPNDLGEGTYVLAATLQTESPLTAKTTFIIGK